MTRHARRYIIISWLTLALGCGRSPSPAYSQPPSEGSLEQLVAPIALYPDPLVAQILPASTNPMEVLEAADAIASGARPSEATASQWSPAIQALLSYPTVLKMMNDRIQWTTKLGQAVVSNQGGVLAAIQQVRKQAQSAGNLKTTPQQTVTTQGSNVVIMPANPEVIYVPQYNPVAILAPAPYYAYAPLMTFGVGFAAGAATAYACDWGYHGYGSVTVNNNYHYNYSNNYSGSSYHSTSSGSYSEYHPQSGTYTGYNAKTGTYGAYNPSTGKYGTYNPSTGQYNRDGTTGYHPPPSDSYHSSGSTSDYHSSGSTSGWGDHSSWGSGGGSGGDAFHGVGGGGWGAQDASSRGWGSSGDRGGGGGGWGGGGGGGGFDRGGGGGGWGGGRGFGGGGGFGGFRGGGFGGRR